jgi:hypothetical protein
MAILDVATATVAELQDAFAAGEADAHVGAPRMAGPFPNSALRRLADCRPRRWRSPHRFSNYQPRIAQHDSASCICRKSTGGFFL